MLRILPKSEPWEKWLVASGAMPPNFNLLPTIPFLPDPLRFVNGREVKIEDWPKRRAELHALFQFYVTGNWPASPGNTRVAEFNQRVEAGSTVQDVTLEFGPNHAAKLHLEVIVPNGKGPFPVFMTQENHRQWALVARAFTADGMLGDQITLPRAL